MKTRIFFILPLFLFISVACNKLTSNPELKDPIYLDIQSDIRSLEKTIFEKNKSLDTLVANSQNLLPRSKELKKLNTQYYETKNELFKLNQKLMYLNLRLQTKRIQDQKEYLSAYKNKTEWPNKQTIKFYFDQKKMISKSKTLGNQKDTLKAVTKDSNKRTPASSE